MKAFLSQAGAASDPHLPSGLNKRMNDPDALTQGDVSTGTPQVYPKAFRRMRPPELETLDSGENRVALRPGNDKLGKRSSKLGLRNFFSRQKTGSDSDMRSFKSGPRGSLYGGLSMPSDLSLPAIPGTHNIPASVKLSSPVTPTQRSDTSRPSSASRPKRSSIVGWEPPPLFKAYPQAVKDSILPACTLSLEALVRLNANSKGSISTVSQDLIHGLLLGTDIGHNSSMGEKPSEATMKKHRRRASGSSVKLDWTTKVYVLVTCGYLLQYSGDGPFNRLPEKILQLGKDSAAFASDLIPGRHWVIQVSSSMDADGTQLPESKPLLSRLQFRASDKRNASNLLMVFESAEEMGSWMTTLRSEIEGLGGKRKLPETGKQEMDSQAQLVNFIQRALVNRDPDRFSRVFTSDAVTDASTQPPSNLSNFLDTADTETIPDQSLDGDSITTSMISHDGRQLENLRDSANRLSFISSGQRTIITSAGSSPACSPTRDSFGSQIDDTLVIQTIPPDVRPRPNAAAIRDRRQSMQTMNPCVDAWVAIKAPRPLSVQALQGAEGSSHFEAASHPATWNSTSYPSASKRLSSGTSTLPYSAPPTSPPGPRRAAPLRGIRRPPPVALEYSRPLSIVADQPSPPQTTFMMPPSPDQQQTETTEMLNVSPERAHFPEGPSHHPKLSHPHKVSQMGSFTKPVQRSPPRRHASMQTLRPAVEVTLSETEEQSSVPSSSPSTVSDSPTLEATQVPPLDQQAVPTMAALGRSQSKSPMGRPVAQAPSRRSSMFESSSEKFIHHPPAQGRLAQFEPREPPPLRPLPPVPSAMDSQPAAIAAYSLGLEESHTNSKRNTVQMVEGPPPAPPPTCALPPIPQQMSPPPNGPLPLPPPKIPRHVTSRPQDFI